ncbi:adenosylcobalamin-dependent ribonucleoside-diphosphate reductase [Phenylobacterium montanum]|uniref:Vitamin B12-dependent ribonucleotide reductase n=1 Tax=Phenylobacterium montanum TaxID=2823693 RepID=A0A975FX32_9CAUL|nr:adenosylcobalamin-dependent ribonucleoside-diphosphate reductase [Caulobacter sp. S6]QUD86890.1 adenosylcobalamin-dependent ribonucleoside-diphosphate reductase [Caulobacter sp. S6]
MNGASPSDGAAESLAGFVWRTRYRAPGEGSLDDTLRRVARATAAAEQDRQGWEARFYAVLKDLRFVPGGRILAGAGRPGGATLLNCFVLPGPGASVERCMASLSEAMVTLCAGGGVGIDFSGAPQRGAAVADGPAAPGPVALLALWDQACAVLLAEAQRRGAMMGALNCAHPDVETFAAAKGRPGALPRFDLSIGITDGFMAAVEADRAWTLRFPIAAGGRAPGRLVRARDLWRHIMTCAYETGEPGVLFLDRIDEANNLRGQERIATTNPCGEIPLPDYGGCTLGSLNLARFVKDPFTERARLDLAGLAQTAATAVRLLDNVIDLSPYPLPKQAEAARSSRRVGLGIMGLADALVMLGMRYGEPASLQAAAEMMRAIRDAAYGASIGLAREKGAFPVFQRDAYLASPFVQALPPGVRDGIAEHGIRNSHLLAIAPTGAISLLAGAGSSGLEPIFDEVRSLTVAGDDGSAQAFQVLDPAVAAWRAMGRSARPPGYVEARELSIAAHLGMQAALQPFVDNAISKTVNVASDLPFEAFQDIYRDAHRLGLKGCTVFRGCAARACEA